jgi:hypothetical protein
MSKVFQRFHRASPLSAQRCCILDAPLEVRLAIYHYIAPAGFLPSVSYREYMGLFLSCKNIHDEMEHETIRATPNMLRILQERDIDETSLQLRPSRPIDFTCLMNVTIGVPHWALSVRQTQAYIFTQIAPLLVLHLSSLTIDIENLGTEPEIYKLIKNLPSRDFWQYMDAHFNRNAGITEGEDKTNYYGAPTTYAIIARFATAINCLVAPQLCNGQHNQDNHWCIRKNVTHRPPTVTCNIRRVALRLRKLHYEEKCLCGGLPHDIYRVNSVWFRWCPTHELTQLRSHGWSCLWTDERDQWRPFSRRNPGRFTWVKLPEKKGSFLKRAATALVTAVRKHP